MITYDYMSARYLCGQPPPNSPRLLSKEPRLKRHLTLPVVRLIARGSALTILKINKITELNQTKKADCRNHGCYN